MKNLKINSWQIRNPLLLFGFALVLGIIFLTAISFGTAVICIASYVISIVIPLVLVLIVISAPLHYILRFNGKRGFFSRTKNGTLQWEVSRRSFACRKN